MLCGMWVKLEAGAEASIHNALNTATFEAPLAPEVEGRQKHGFPKIGVPFWGVPIMRIIVFGGILGVPLFWETPT